MPRKTYDEYIEQINQAKDHYEILGVSKEATEGEIRKAYKNMARVIHPDKAPEKNEEATDNFKKINNAHETLSDSDNRQRYDSAQQASAQSAKSSVSIVDMFKSAIKSFASAVSNFAQSFANIFKNKGPEGPSNN